MKLSSDILLLFDIDGTLMRRSGPHHRQALVEAIRHVTNLETTTDGIPVHGMLDPDILTGMLLRAGASPDAIRQSLPHIQTEAQHWYESACPPLTFARCPGIPRLLRQLRRDHIPCALVTGNLERIGWRKLRAAGLAQFFLYGSFAGTARTRAGLARNAIRIARKRGLLKRHTQVWLIGDAPSDVLAARANRIGCVAVHTGVSSPRDLGRLKPRKLKKDLMNLRLGELRSPNRA